MSLRLRVCLSPDVLVSDGEGLTERLGRVQPDGRVLLSSYRCLSRDRGRTHVQSAGDGRQQSVIVGVWANTCRGTEEKVKGQASVLECGVFRFLMETYSAVLWADPWTVGLLLRCPMIAVLSISSPKTAAGSHDRTLSIRSHIQVSSSPLVSLALFSALIHVCCSVLMPTKHFLLLN